MSKTITRRDILKFTGGGILGVILSPLPWKMLDDSAIWTQNWSLIPKLAHGPISTAFSHCTLCGGGCAIKAQCVSGMPYFISGVQHHPITNGTLCVNGLAGHHMAHHPLRIVHPHKFEGKSGKSKMTAVSLQNALDEIALRIKNSTGTVAVIDQQPTRVLSEIYRTFVAKTTNGVYLTSPSCEDATITALQIMMDRKSESFGFDFENTKLILSFGAPLLDGWGTPGRMTTLRNSRTAKFIQFDSRYSRTAMQSDKWIALKPGTEKTAALSIAYVLINDSRIAQHVNRSAVDAAGFKNIVQNFSPEKTFSVTGIEPGVITAIASELIHAESAIVLSGADPGGGPFDYETEKAIASLNLLIGSVGKTGGIISRNTNSSDKQSSEISRWSDIPDHSIEVLIVDGAESGYALPWKLIEKKLIPGKNFVISLSPILNELSAHSDYLIPSSGHLETLCDIPTPSGNSVAGFSLSVPLLKKQEFTTEPIDVIKALSTSLNYSLAIPTYEELLKAKTESIHSKKSGTVFSYSDQRTINVADIPTTGELWNILTTGAQWMDVKTRQTMPKKFTFALKTATEPAKEIAELTMIVHGWRGTTSASQMSPILSKVFQETELRSVNGIVSINPLTAQQLGLSQEEPATISTSNGPMKVRIKIDSAIRQGVIEASVGPQPNGSQTPLHLTANNILNLCEVNNDGTWRITTATLLKA